MLHHTGTGIHGREAELAALDGVLDRTRGGFSSSLVLRGEAGIGKSTLLEEAARRATDMHVMRCAGVESETGLAFAGLHLLLHRHAGLLDRLPAVQGDALRSALGLGDAPAHDRFLVGMGLLTLLSDIAADGPVLCLIDDAHWMDKASLNALLFAARRLDAEPVSLVFAVRAEADEDGTSGLPELVPGRLDDGSAGRVLDDHAGGLPVRARDRIVEEAEGNPLALIELAAAHPPAERALPQPYRRTPPASHQVRRAYAERIRALPDPSQIMLAVVAAEPTGELAVVLQAAGRLGASLGDLETAERRRLLHVQGGRVAFHHPLMRSIAYADASTSRRLAVHRALADALDRETDAGRRAWHLAAGAVAPDADIAAELERHAEHARARGGFAEVVVAYERAAALSPEHRQRSRRYANAARAALDAGRPRWADELAGHVAPSDADPPTRAALAEVRGRVACEEGDLAAAHALLLDASTAVAATDPVRSAFLLLESMGAAWRVGDDALVDATAAQASALSALGQPDVTLVADGVTGLAAMYAGRSRDGLPSVRALIAGVRDAGTRFGLRERTGVLGLGFMSGETDMSMDLAQSLQDECRMRGAIGVLPEVLLHLAIGRLVHGRHKDALITATEGLRVAQDTGQGRQVGPLQACLAHLAALEGDEDRCRALAREAYAHRDSLVDAWCDAALCLLELGLGNHEQAVVRMADHTTFAAWRNGCYGHHYRVESGVRLGAADRVADSVAYFDEWAAHTEQPWTKAVALRHRALLGPDDEAEAYYTEALVHHASGGNPFERARTELLFGEWLRRSRRRADARRHLRSAADLFQRLGTAAWTERAYGELRAAGDSSEAAVRRAPDVLGRLTPQELQVARLAARGMTNRDIAAQLFLSPRTVGYHLYKAYPKLGVSSRHELPRTALEEAP